MNALYWNFACHQSGYPDASIRSASNGTAARVSGDASGRNPSGTSSPSIVRTFTPGVTSTCSACQGCVTMPTAALPAVRPNCAVRPVEAGRAAERGDQHVAGQPGRREAARQEAEPGPAAPGHQQVHAVPGDQQAHVLLDQQQGRRGEDGRPAPPGLEAFRHHGREHRDERHLVEVERDRRHDRQRQRVRRGDEVGARRAELAGGEGPQRRDGQGEQDRLSHQQRRRAVVDPVQRREHGQDR